MHDLAPSERSYTTWPGGRVDVTDEYIWPHVIRSLESLPHDATILDAGCGNGRFADHISQLGYRIHGIDAEQSGIAAAQRLNSAATFSTASVCDDMCGLPGAPFDALVSLEVIEHLYSPRAFMQRAFGCTKPGGLLIVSTPYHGYLKNLMLAVSGKMDAHYTALWEFGHIKFWSRRTLTILAEREGFVFKSFSGAGRLPFLWKSMVLTFRRPTA